jgi:hypothetical protein
MINIWKPRHARHGRQSSLNPRHVKIYTGDSDFLSELIVERSSRKTEYISIWNICSEGPVKFDNLLYQVEMGEHNSRPFLEVNYFFCPPCGCHLSSMMSNEQLEWGRNWKCNVSKSVFGWCCERSSRVLISKKTTVWTLEWEWKDSNSPMWSVT